MIRYFVERLESLDRRPNVGQYDTNVIRIGYLITVAAIRFRKTRELNGARNKCVHIYMYIFFCRRS